MEIIKAIFRLKSIAPIKMDKWVDFEGNEPKTTEEYKKAAVLKAYRTEEGDLGIEARAIKACMRLASSHLGKKMEAKKNRQAIQAGVFITPPVLSFGRKDYDTISIDVVTRKGTGDKVTRVKTYRPLTKEWAVEGEMALVGVTPNFAHEALDLGGFLYGLLSHRPEFGRFVVEKFEVME